MSAFNLPGARGPRDPGKPPPISGTVILFTAIILLVAYYARRTGHLTEDTIIYFVVLIPSVVLHEISHGWLANMFGDPTAKQAGRLTLNPLRHIDPLGTVIIPAVLILTSGTAFGYAKPVPVNTTHMSRNKAMFVGLVGPATNIVIALVAAGLIQLTFNGTNQASLLIRIALQFGIANVTLATFNLIPIPPLDGSSVIERFLPQRYMGAYYQFRQYSMFILLILAFSARASIAQLFDPAINLWAHLLP